MDNGNPGHALRAIEVSGLLFDVMHSKGMREGLLCVRVYSLEHVKIDFVQFYSRFGGDFGANPGMQDTGDNYKDIIDARNNTCGFQVFD